MWSLCTCGLYIHFIMLEICLWGPEISDANKLAVSGSIYRYRSFCLLLKHLSKILWRCYKGPTPKYPVSGILPVCCTGKPFQDIYICFCPTGGQRREEADDNSDQSVVSRGQSRAVRLWGGGTVDYVYYVDMGNFITGNNRVIQSRPKSRTAFPMWHARPVW